MRKSSTNLYILSLSIVNTIVLIGYILLYGLRSLLYNHCKLTTISSTSYEVFYILIFCYIYPIQITVMLISIYLTASVALNRFIIICLPARMRKFHLRKSSISVIIGICLFCILYCLPFWFEFTHHKEQTTDDSNSIHLTLVLSSFGQGRLFRILMRKYLYLIFVFLLPLLLLISCKTCIIRRLIIQRAKKRLLGTKTHQNNSITLLLLSIVGIFLLTQFPYFLFNLLYAVRGPQYLERTSARLYLTVNNLLSVINASSVFVLYSLFGQEFRHVLRITFCCPKSSSTKHEHYNLI
ncbi:unnamed protein product [Didymodactylos carnosus]|uniref:G-protein coupled receptors family 1 profile domain-containing protein n=1 Tax=Didymodactylos carnosus TaxID=1234261 RepID=A0A815GGP6_9BILA|nr:unnamed protein product [Didymodactylos carnosus]CAF1398061.1 unnamed protein product [Didymodactylos carnosus]CAF4197114.1 unnamed protein product [Didymodactylos carnosus]CAF4205476.1 unnamed protein product [Didymodactylos carnosus]